MNVRHPRFARPHEIADSAFVAVDRALLAEHLCIEEARVVAGDNTITYGRRKLHLPQSPLRRHYVKAWVRLREYPDGTLAVFHARSGSPDTTATASHSRRPPQKPLRDPFRRSPFLFNRSGQMTCYKTGHLD